MLWLFTFSRRRNVDSHHDWVSERIWSVQSWKLLSLEWEQGPIEGVKWWVFWKSNHDLLIIFGVSSDAGMKMSFQIIRTYSDTTSFFLGPGSLSFFNESRRLSTWSSDEKRLLILKIHLHAKPQTHVPSNTFPSKRVSVIYVNSTEIRITHGHNPVKAKSWSFKQTGSTGCKSPFISSIILLQCSYNQCRFVHLEGQKTRPVPASCNRGEDKKTNPQFHSSTCLSRKRNQEVFYDVPSILLHLDLHGEGQTGVSLHPVQIVCICLQVSDHLLNGIAVHLFQCTSNAS